MARLEFQYTEIDKLLYPNIEIDEKQVLITWEDITCSSQIPNYSI